MSGINNIYLIVTNDGNGDQCGTDYKTRCVVFKDNRTKQATLAAHALKWAAKADMWQANQGGKHLNPSDLLTAASQIAHYYVQHVKEMEG